MSENEETKVGKKRKCFVITPIGEDGTSIRRHIDGIIKAAIRPALQDKYEVRAAHEFTTTGSINNQVIVEIYTADLVVANLTELNPNVMYELAIRHALKKPVIMIMEKGGKGLPFDVNNERTIFYINDSQGVLDLCEEIKKTEITLSANNISNPIYDALIGYTSDESLIKNVESNSKEDADVLKIILNKINSLEKMISKANNELSSTLDYEKEDIYIHFLDARELNYDMKYKILADFEKIVREILEAEPGIKNVFLKDYINSAPYIQVSFVMDRHQTDLNYIIMSVSNNINKYLLEKKININIRVDDLPF